MLKHFWNSQSGTATLEFSMVAAMIYATLLAAVPKMLMQKGLPHLLGTEISWIQAKIMFALH